LEFFIAGFLLICISIV
jgi:meckelin